MTLLHIVWVTFAGGVLSVFIAASLTVHALGRLVPHLVYVSAGGHRIFTGPFPVYSLRSSRALSRFWWKRSSSGWTIVS